MKKTKLEPKRENVFRGVLVLISIFLCTCSIQLSSLKKTITYVENESIGIMLKNHSTINCAFVKQSDLAVVVNVTENGRRINKSISKDDILLIRRQDENHARKSIITYGLLVVVVGLLAYTLLLSNFRP